MVRYVGLLAIIEKGMRRMNLYLSRVKEVFGQKEKDHSAYAAVHTKTYQELADSLS